MLKDSSAWHRAGQAPCLCSASHARHPCSGSTSRMSRHIVAAGGRNTPEPLDNRTIRPAPADLEGANPRWRWPGFGQPTSPPPPPPPIPPPPPPSSFQDAPFGFWGPRRQPAVDQASSTAQSPDPWSPQPQPSGRPPSRGEARSVPAAPRPAWWQPRVQGFAQRLFRNPEIQKLAQAEIEAREEDVNTAPVSRGFWGLGSRKSGQGQRTVPPPDVDNISDTRQYNEDFADWIEFKRQQRAKQRSMNQEGEIWGIVKVYLFVALVLIFAGLFWGK